MKKRLLSIILAAVMTMSLASCASTATTTVKETNKADSAQTEASVAADESAAETLSADTLTVAIWDTNQQAGLQSIIDDWSAISGIKAEIQVISWNEYWTLLEAGASGGTLPDVFWMHSNNAQKYMENDLLLDLTDKIAASDSLDLSKFFPEMVNLYNSDGKQYAVPKDIDTIGLWYNKTMFDEAGLAYPDDTWTWEKLYETAKLLTKADGSQFGYAINTGNNQDSYYNAIYSYGGSVLSDDKSTSGYDDPKTIAAMQVFEKMLAEKICPDLATISENGADVLFKSGKVAMITQGSWMVPSFRDDEYTFKNCDVAVLPTGPDGLRVSIYNGLGWAAAANGKNTDAAWSLIEYLGTEKAQLKQAELGVTMSAIQGMSDAWKNAVPAFHLQSYVDMLSAKLVFRPYSRSTTAWEDMATEEFKAAWTGDATMADTCAKIAAQMNEILAAE